MADGEIGSFDYVIVGAGTAGCVLANRLSADPDVSVLLLEAGGKDDWIWVHIPVGYLYTQNHPRTDWCLRTEPEPGLGGRALAYPRGKVLGGCSSINGMIYMHGQARDYEQALVPSADPWSDSAFRPGQGRQCWGVELPARFQPNARQNSCSARSPVRNLKAELQRVEL
jgi:choline dehydrogenase-like flavoprotein